MFSPFPPSPSHTHLFPDYLVWVLEKEVPNLFWTFDYLEPSTKKILQLSIFLQKHSTWMRGNILQIDSQANFPLSLTVDLCQLLQSLAMWYKLTLIMHSKYKEKCLLCGYMFWNISFIVKPDKWKFIPFLISVI